MIKDMVSIVIPARNEQFLQNTIHELLDKSEGEIEVIVNLDGYWPDPPLKDDNRLIVIHRGISHGMRPGINSAVAISRGEYIMKIDAHCMVDQGYDVKLKRDCEDDWVIVPRRKRLDAENWCIQESGKPDIDYMYLSFPDNPNDFGGPGLNGKVWDGKNRDSSLNEDKIVDLMSAQGSCWFMKRSYFDKLELMDYKNYGLFWNEFQEIGLKAWLSGGQVKRNKNTWYAHLHKGKKYGRGYYLSKDSLKQGATFTSKWITNDAWDKQTKPLSWLIEHFWPVPTWPDNWRDQLYGPEGEAPIKV
jgi:glycosyltransferase involved in cell wall biosynthesis